MAQKVNRVLNNARALLILGTALMLVLAPAHARAAAPCDTVITACGCEITQSKVFTVANNLDASQTSEPNCIEIVKDHAILNLKGFRVIGNNAGIGILIKPGAHHVIVEGGDEADNDPPQDPANDLSPQSTPLRQAVVSQWDIGIEDDADNAVIELFDAIGGVDVLGGPHTPGNVTAGVVLKHVSNSIVGDLRANYNGKFGVMLDHSSNVQLANFTTKENGIDGVRLDSCNDNRISESTSPGNTQLGTGLIKSDRNTLYNSVDTGSMDTGILVGCGLDEKNCKGHERSDRNRIVLTTSSGNKKAGIVIRKHSETNTVTLTRNNNGGKNMDMVDENPHCDSNVWYNNTGQGNQACIR